MFYIQTDEMQPFFMSHSFEWFCEEIGRILDTRDVYDVDEMAIDTVTNEVNAEVDVFHPVV